MRQMTRLILAAAIALLGAVALLSVRSYFVGDGVSIGKAAMPSSDPHSTQARYCGAHSASGSLELWTSAEESYLADDEPAAPVAAHWTFERFSGSIDGTEIPEYSTERRQSTRRFGPLVTWADGWQSSEGGAVIHGCEFPIWPSIPVAALVALTLGIRAVRRRRRWRGAFPVRI